MMFPTARAAPGAPAAFATSPYVATRPAGIRRTTAMTRVEKEEGNAGSGFGVRGSGFRFGVRGSGFRFRVRGSGFRFRVQGSGFGVPCSGFGVWSRATGEVLLSS
jgi:hypothetical protein